MPKFHSYQQTSHPTAILADNESLYYDKQVINEFVNSSYGADELFKTISEFSIHLAIPLIIVGRNNGLLRVDIKNENVEDIVDVKHCMYLYAPREIKHASRVLVKDSNFPVIICNERYLDDCLKSIEAGAKSSVDDIMRQIENQPYLLYYEVYDKCLTLRQR
jgi:hypothetical protein